MNLYTISSTLLVLVALTLLFASLWQPGPAASSTKLRPAPRGKPFRYRRLDQMPVAYHALMQSLPDMIVILDTRHLIVDLNAAAERIIGMPAQAASGRPLIEILPASQALLEGETQARSIHAELSHQVDGTARTYDAQVAPLINRWGRIGGKVMVLRDITERRAAQEALRKFYRAVEQSPASVVITDTTGAIEYVNPKFTLVTGYTFAEVQGQNPRILKTEATTPETYASLWAAISAGHAWEGELYNRKKDGSCYWEAASISPIFNADGIITHYVAVKIDITARTRMEEELRRNEATLARAQAIAGLGNFCYSVRTGRMILSSQLCRIVGLGDTEQHLTVAEVRKLIHPDDRARIRRAFYAVLTGVGSAALDMRLMGPNGTVYYLHNQFEVAFDREGRPYEVFGTAQDITYRKLVEEALKEARDAAEAASRAKSSFLANMSHELRTPLNAILGFSQVLCATPGLTAHQYERLGIIHRSGKHLLALINDILDMSKIEAGRITLNEHFFDLPSLLDDLERMFHIWASEKQLRLRFERAPDMPQVICTDPVRLRQALINLLSNALKFTTEGSVTLRVSVVGDQVPPLAPKSAGEQSAHCVLRFDVEDTGPGIAPDDIDLIFEPFTQSLVGQRVPEGTGLGLTISRSFAQLLGGDLTVRSEIGQGASFRLEIRAGLPAAHLYAEQAESTEAAPSEPGQRAPLLSPADNEPGSALAGVEANILAQIEEAVLVGDLAHLDVLTDLIAQTAPTAASYLKALSYGFAYDTILASIQAARTEGKSHAASADGEHCDS